jgi:hypothetical protein
MTHSIQQLTRDISKVDLQDVCSCWQWLLKGQNQVILISDVGDLFLMGKKVCSEKRDQFYS